MDKQKLAATTSNEHKNIASSTQSITKISDDILNKKPKYFLWCEFIAFLPGIILLIPSGL